MDQVDVDLALLGWGVGVNTSDTFKALYHVLIVRVLDQTSKVTAENAIAELDLLCILSQFTDILDDGTGGSESFITLCRGVPDGIKLIQLCVDGVVTMGTNLRRAAQLIAAKSSQRLLRHPWIKVEILPRCSQVDL
jgi:hypothetical protein